MEENQCLATIIIPTFDHGITIQYPLECLRRQTISNFEVYVIGDGVPVPQKPRLLELVASDERFKFVDRPKHGRRGEPYRHEVLLKARGRIVCYLCDRDLWLPDHLERMLELLTGSDYAHSLPLHMYPGNLCRTFPADLSAEVYLQLMLTQRDNRIPFSCFAHTLDAYHSLPEGWFTTPDEQWTDLHMFRKFFAMPSLRGVSGLSPTAVTFPSPPRMDWPPEKRCAELDYWWKRLSTLEGRLNFELDILRDTVIRQRREVALLAQALEEANQKLLACQSNPTTPKIA